VKKLTEAQGKQLETLAMKLRDTHSDLTSSVQDYNAQVAELYGAVEVAQDAYNSAVEEANEFVQGIVSDIENYVDERSDKWKESDAGQVLFAWLEEWQSVDLEESCLDMPDELDEPDEGGVDAFDALPPEA
jgi:outer membrane murein-binding lipoprotein Lpp